MLLSRHVFGVLWCCCFIYCMGVNKTRKRNLMELLGFLQSVNDTFLLPPVIIFPTFILPAQKTTKENETSIIATLKQKPLIENLFDEDKEDDIEANFRQSLNRGTTTKRTKTGVTKAISLRQSVDTNTDTNNTTIFENTTNFENVTEETTIEMTSSTEPSDFYPSANYNNSEIDGLLLAIAIPEQQLPLENDKWHNYSESTNINVQINNTLLSVSDSTTEQSKSTNEGPYSAAHYNNAVIDQLSITTNSYTNEESPLPSPKSDRWRTFSSMEKIPSATGFKPLAGLYYDGFLHKPLIMLPGFIPRKYYNLY